MKDQLIKLHDEFEMAYKGNGWFLKLQLEKLTVWAPTIIV